MEHSPTENRRLRDYPRLDVEDLITGGYLLEVNRQVLHPMGLALAVVPAEDGSDENAALVVIDARSDPEGIRVADDSGTARSRAETFEEEWLRRRPERYDRLGWMVQPRGDL